MLYIGLFCRISEQCKALMTMMMNNKSRTHLILESIAASCMSVCPQLAMQIMTGV